MDVRQVAVRNRCSRFPTRGVPSGPTSTTLAHNCGWAPSDAVSRLWPSFVLVIDVVEIDVLAAAERGIEERTVDVRAVLHHLAANVALVIELLEVVVDDFAGIVAVVGFGPHRREVDLDQAVGHAVFEFFGAPAGAPVEREPLVHRPAVGLQVEREHARVCDRVVRAVENVVRLLAVVVNRLVGHLGDRPDVVTERQARHAAHVAVLALNALLARRRRTILLPHDFELDARVHGDLVAGRAEFAARERLEIDAGHVDVLAGALFVGRCLDLEMLFAVDGFGNAVAADAAHHRGKHVARLDPPLAVRFAVDVLHAMAGDAGDALAGYFGQIPQRLGSRTHTAPWRSAHDSACRSSRRCRASSR